MTKKVLVLGGSGFIGRSIVKHLLNSDCSVTSADCKDSQDLLDIKNSSKGKMLEVINADFSESSSFKSLSHSYDEIYMLAALVGVNRTLKNPSEVIRINTSLTMNTLDYVKTNPVKKILFSSSSENYAGTSDLFNYKIPTDEKVPLCIEDIKHPRWTYAMTKMHGEAAFLHCANALNYEATVVRYQNIIGPNMGFGHAIPHIVERFVKDPDGPIKIYGHDQTRAFCFVDDAVSGTVLAMESKMTNGQIYHIGKDEEISIKELYLFIGEILGYKGDYEDAITYPGSVNRRCPEINKARNDFGYNPQIDWQEAVEKTVIWYKDYFESGKTPDHGGFEAPEKVMKKMSDAKTI